MSRADLATPSQHALIAAEERLRLLMENVADHAILFLDPRGNIVDVGLGAEKTLGYREEETVGRHYSLIFTPEDNAKDVAGRELRSAVETGRGIDERWHVRKDRSRFWAAARRRVTG